MDRPSEAQEGPELEIGQRRDATFGLEVRSETRVASALMRVGDSSPGDLGVFLQCREDGVVQGGAWREKHRKSTGLAVLRLWREVWSDGWRNTRREKTQGQGSRSIATVRKEWEAGQEGQRGRLPGSWGAARRRVPLALVGRGSRSFFADPVA